MNKTLHQVGESPRPIFRKQALQEGAARLLFTLTACISILAVVLICVFLFANGIPGMAKIGVWDFLSGQKWKPGNEIFGILPFILGSIYVTAGALIVGVPAGLLTAIFMSRFASKRIHALCRQSPSHKQASQKGNRPKQNCCPAKGTKREASANDETASEVANG